MYLYEKLAGAREYGAIKPAPEYIAANLNLPVRKYQREAFENFITHFESPTCPKPTQVLFHMATGSGKTLIMAGLILYLYAQGYRNFLFFVNLSNIVEKTRDNFLEPTAAKYLFARDINIDGKRIRVNATDNFQQADADAINICFSTTQGLHMAMNFVKENGMTPDDFRERKVVLISDEAHHLNVSTKKLSAAEENNRKTWEDTVKKILHMNKANVLLEFTATCDLANAQIKAEYENKIVFDYPLKKFYTEGYSKEIITFRNTAQDDRVLTALILSQYRFKLFADIIQRNIKPVVLFKSAKVSDSKDFMEKFIERVKNLRGNDLRKLSEISKDEIVRKAFDYFASKGITFEMLADELRRDFSKEHCISANDKDIDKNQIALNTLESPSNPYRAVFEVRKLDEGWDVLNLFDIVRLYETRQSGGKKISPVTIAEAQLIGRGARYCPFEFKGETKDKRKFDGDLANDLRICETLYYHCQNDSRYIEELHKALREIGLDIDAGFKREYKLKETFKSDDLYKEGIIFLNDREEVPQEFRAVIPKKPYSFKRIGGGGRDKVMTKEIESVNHKVKIHTTHTTIGEIAKKNYTTVHKALRQNPIYSFDRLKKNFPDLKSTREFITGEEYLRDITIAITSNELEPSIATLYAAACNVLSKIADELSKTEKKYIGTEFKAQAIQAVFHDKIVRCPESLESGSSELAESDWLVYNYNYSTSEEKAFVEYFGKYVDDLKKKYSKVYLVRNEREAKIYSFEDGNGFEPDFVLFLQKKNADACEQYQIFIEPKGEHLIEHDAWKEKFLRELTDKNIVKPLDNNTTCRICGLSFYNRDTESNFEKEFRASIVGNKKPPVD